MKLDDGRADLDDAGQRGEERTPAVTAGSVLETHQVGLEMALVDVTERRCVEAEKGLLLREPEAGATVDGGRPRISEVPSSPWG